MNDEDLADIKEVLHELVANQYLGVLGTQQGGQPHTSLVGFIASDSFDKIIFATPRSTRKYENLKTDNRIAFLIDSRTRKKTDFHAATAATAYGTAQELTGQERDTFGKMYLSKFPFLKKFLASPTCALMIINVNKYSIVNKFQNVFEYYPGK